MGTNYYCKTNQPCKECFKNDIDVYKKECWTCFGTGFHHLHIGKRSFGWKFTFQAYPTLGLTSYQKWLEYLIELDVPIVNEYRDYIYLEEMLEIINDTYIEKNKIAEDPVYHYQDKEGYAFSRNDFS